MEDIVEIFAKNLNSLMETRGENLTFLSDSLGVAYSTVSDWQHGNKMPRSGSLQKIAEHYGVNISYLTTEHNNVVPVGIGSYNYFDAGLSAGIPNEVDPFTSNDVTQIQLSDIIMGKYAGDKNIFISHLNGESMNRVIPDRSLIAVKQTDKSELENGDIVVFEENGCYSVKRYYNNLAAKVVTFSPDSTENVFEPMAYRYEDMDDIRIVGKVVMYVVTE